MVTWRRLSLSAALSLGLAGSAIGADATVPPATSDACMQHAYGLAEVAETNPHAGVDLEKLEELLTKMESQCAAQEFAEAMISAAEIKAMIDRKP